MSAKSFFAIAALFATTIVHAHSFKVGDIEIEHPHARVTVGKQANGAAYMEIENKGKTDDALLSASSPVADSVEVHTMRMEGDVMKMRAVDSLEIKVGDEVKMKPGEGYHIMLMGLKNPLKAGEKFPMTLTFRQAGTVKITVHVSDKAMTGKPGKADDKVDAHEHHNH